MRPAELWHLLKETAAAWYEDKTSTLGAALAYYAVFAVAPLVVIAVAIAGMVFGEQAARGELSQQVSKAFGPTIAKAIEEIVAQIHQEHSGSLATAVSVLLLLIAAAGLFGQLQEALNTIWKVASRPGRTWWDVIRDRLLPYLVVLVMGCVLLVFLLAEWLLGAVGGALGLTPVMSGPVLKTLNWLVNLALVALVFAVIYKILPDAKIRWRDVWVGGLLTAILFTIGNHLIGLYLAWSGVASVYGAAGSLIVVLLWVYYSSQVLLFGAEFTRVYSCRFGGAPQPAANAVPVGAEDLANEGRPRTPDIQRTGRDQPAELGR